MMVLYRPKNESARKAPSSGNMYTVPDQFVTCTVRQ